MRHRIKDKKFNRNSNARKGLFKALVRSLVEHGSIVTTHAKAKEIKRIADKLIGKAQTDTIESRRRLHRFFGVRDVVNTLVERIAPEFPDRVSGFTSISKLGVRRGDNSSMVKLSLAKMPKDIGTLKPVNSKTTVKDVKKAPAKKKTTVKKNVSVKAHATKNVMATKTANKKVVRSSSVKKESK
jgi:large subunit ribosomal protein L17